MQTKAAIRSELREKRSALTPHQVAAASEAIAKQLLREIDWAQQQSVHVYRAQASWNELETSEFIANLHRTFPNIVIDIPAVAPSTPIPTKPYDVIIVPVLGFDTQGYRLGLGSGWYDRFLANQPQALKVGLAYRDAQCATLPHEPHDIPLDRIFTA